MRKIINRLTIGIILCCISGNIYAQEKYIMHSSGLVLARRSSDNRTVIVSKNSTDAKKLIILKRNNNQFNIASVNNRDTLYMTKDGSWNTYFKNDKNVSGALWTSESVSSTLIKLKCAENNLYLGTDATDNNASVFCDKSGSDAKHYWYFTDDKNKELPIDTINYIVNPAIRRQLNEGWGVSLCWWARMCGNWSDKKLDEIITWLVSPTGLNFNIFRYNIGGGDDPENHNCTPHHMGNGKGLRAEMEGFQDERGGPYIWTRDAGQRRVMLKIKEKRPDAIFEAFSNSCPWWMTYSGCCSGNTDGGKDNLRPEYYTDFANYLVDVCKHYKDEYGIEFKTLEPFNESVTNFWYCNGPQEGCHFDFESQVKFIKVLSPILKKSGLKTVISAGDETNVGLQVNGINAFKSGGVMNMIGQLNTHTYSGSDLDRCRFGSLSRASGKPYWMSEVGSGGNGIGGNLSMAQHLITDIRYILPDAWIDWQYVEEANDQWCFVRGSFNDQTYYKVKNYYVRQHFTRFIKAGYNYVTSLGNSTLAALSPQADSLVVVIVNESSEAIHNISLPFCTANKVLRTYLTDGSHDISACKNATIKDNLLTVKMPQQSIITVIVSVDDVIDLTDQFDTQTKYLIIPQANNMLALTDNKSSINVEYITGQPNQLWELSEGRTSGEYYFTSGDGRILTFSGSYNMISATKKVTTTQSFKVKTADGYHCKISERSGKCLDLSGQGTGSGTAVGMYAYSDVSDVTRHWLLIPVSREEESDAIKDIIADSQMPNETIYDLQGRKVSHPSKGLYIINNKAVFIR